MFRACVDFPRNLVVGGSSLRKDEWGKYIYESETGVFKCGPHYPSFKFFIDDN
jgi:hypothetical protein